MTVERADTTFYYRSVVIATRFRRCNLYATWAAAASRVIRSDSELWWDDTFQSGTSSLSTRSAVLFAFGDALVSVIYLVIYTVRSTSRYSTRDAWLGGPIHKEAHPVISDLDFTLMHGASTIEHIPPIYHFVRENFFYIFSPFAQFTRTPPYIPFQ